MKNLLVIVCLFTSSLMLGQLEGITKAYLGETEISKAYLGSTEVYTSVVDPVYGPELVTNGTFDTNTSGWVANDSNLSVDANRLKILINNTLNNKGVWQDITVEVGETYLVKQTITNSTASSTAGFRCTTPTWTAMETSDGVAVGATATIEMLYEATTTTLRVTCDRRAGTLVSGDIIYLDNVSVKKVL